MALINMYPLSEVINDASSLSAFCKHSPAQDKWLHSKSRSSRGCGQSWGLPLLPTQHLCLQPCRRQCFSAPILFIALQLFIALRGWTQSLSSLSIQKSKGSGHTGEKNSPLKVQGILNPFLFLKATLKERQIIITKLMVRIVEYFRRMEVLWNERILNILKPEKLYNVLKNLMCSLSLGVSETLQYSHIINRERKYGNWGKRESWKEEKRSKSPSSTFSSTYFTSSGVELNYIFSRKRKR